MIKFKCKIKLLQSLLVAVILLLPGYAHSQQIKPGNTSLEVELWLKSDAGITVDDQASNRVVVWADQSGHKRNYEQRTAITTGYINRPLYNKFSDLMNFQPSLFFANSRSGTQYQAYNRLLGPADTEYNITGKSFYLFYVSKNTSTSGTSLKTVFSFNRNRSNITGWYGYSQPYFTNRGATSPNSVMGSVLPFGRTYAIVGAIRTNNSGGTSSLYVNGVKQDFPLSGNYNVLQAAGGTTYVQSVIGSSANGNTNSMYGHIQEIIMLSAATGTAMNPVQAQKINSYLAIKYGITLDKTVNYVNSRYEGDPNTNVVWNQSTNAAYNQVVFGIARDDSAGLLVNQARSYDARTLTLFVGDDVKALNSQNKSMELKNRDYLMLGGDSIQKFVSYVHNEGEAISNGVLGTSLNTRGRVYKAQRTGDPDYHVSILPDNPSAKYVVVSDDPNFPLDNRETRFYAVDPDGYARNVDIKDGYYVTTAYNNIMPGAINSTTFNLELWLRGDGLTMPDKSDVSVWSDNSLYGRTFGVYGTSQAPKMYYEGAMNYNGAVDFNKSANARLVSDDQFTKENGKTYYITWVGKLNVISADYNPVFALEQGRGTGWRGQTSTAQSPTGALYMRTGTGSAVTLSSTTGVRLDKNYGIATFAAITGSGSTVGPRVVYHNGKRTQLDAATGSFDPTASYMVIGNTDLTNTDNNYGGNVQEIIVLSSTTGEASVQAELEKMHSYLAVKYGLTLFGNVYRSSFGPVFDGTTGTYSTYNQNVFGIGRDDDSGLYQKQSKSTDDPKFAIFVGDLAEVNNKNNGTLNNGEYIMLGSNGATGLSGLQTPSEIPADMVKDSLRKTNWVYQVKLTDKATTGTISREIRIKQFSSQAKYVMVSTGSSFPVGNDTKYYPFDKNFISDPITLRNGDYIAFLYSVEAPGGVSSGLRMWLHAGDVDKLRYDSNGNIEQWEDRTEISATKYSYMDADIHSGRFNWPPAYSVAAKYMNYRPSVEFRQRPGSGTTQQGEYLSTLKGPGSSAQPEVFTTINVIFQYMGKTARNYFMGFGNTSSYGSDSPLTRHPAFGIIGKDANGKKLAGQVGRIAYYTTGDRAIQGSVPIAKLGATSINLNHVNTTANTIMFEANGVTDSRSTANATGSGTSPFSGFLMNDKGTLGAGSLREAAMVGYMAEAIYYEKTLSSDELNKIYAALAIKYGVTLRLGGGRSNYLLSDNITSVWNGNASGYQTTFYNNVAGLVRDDVGGLFNNISNSTDGESIVTMMVRGHDPNLGQGNESELPVDKSYLFWGNDGAVVDSSAVIKYYTTEERAEFCTPSNYRINRVWAVRKSANLDVARVTLIINNNEDVLNFEGISQPGYRIHLLVADNPAVLSPNVSVGQYPDNKLWSMDVPSTYVKGKGQLIDFNFTDSVTYFTLGVEELTGGGCETCAFSDIQQILFDRTFQKNIWPNRTAAAFDFNIGRDFEVDSLGGLGTQINFNGSINVAFVGLTNARDARFVSPSPRLYQNASKGNILYINRTGQTAIPLRTTIETTSSAAARFQIRGINRYSTRYMTAEVKGYCDIDSVNEGAIIYPRLMEAKTVATTTATSSMSSYTIRRNTATAIRTPYVTARYDSRNRNVVNVRFDAPVKVIVIDQTLTGPRTGSKSISIGDISYYCPAPQPPYNEAGMSTRMTVFPRQVVMCGGVNPFQLEIDVYNADCSNKQITLRDTLPANMYWNEAGFSIDSIAITGATKITVKDYLATGDKRIIQIDSLFIWGAPDPSIPFTFTLSAYFDVNAQPGSYDNQMWMYSKVYRGGSAGNDPMVDLPPYPSADMITGGATPIEAVDGGLKLDYVRVLNDSATITKCYDEKDVVNMSFKIKNPNSISMDSLMFEVEFNEGFTLIDSTVMVNGVYYAPQFESDETVINDSTSTFERVPGYFFIQYTDTTVLSLDPNGEMTVSFKLKAPDDYDSLEKEMNADGTKYLDWEGNEKLDGTPWEKGKQSIVDLGVSATMSTDMDDLCKSSAFDEAYSDMTVIYCQTKKGLVSNKHVTSRKDPH